MMIGYDAEQACAFIVLKLDQKAFRKIWDKVPQMIADFIQYDLQFMHATGVLDSNGEQGENDYDDDEAFEYIYDAWLAAHADQDDEDMLVAALIDAYMEQQYEFLCENGLAEL